MDNTTKPAQESAALLSALPAEQVPDSASIGGTLPIVSSPARREEPTVGISAIARALREYYRAAENHPSSKLLYSAHRMAIDAAYGYQPIRESQELDALRAEVAALKKAAARWTILCNLWAASTELALRQREDGRWEIVQVEDAEGTTFDPLVGDTPDDCISDAMLAAAEEERKHG